MIVLDSNMMTQLFWVALIYGNCEHNVIMMILTLPHQLLGCGVNDSYCWQHGVTVVT